MIAISALTARRADNLWLGPLSPTHIRANQSWSNIELHVPQNSLFTYSNARAVYSMWAKQSPPLGTGWLTISKPSAQLSSKAQVIPLSLNTSWNTDSLRSMVIDFTPIPTRGGDHERKLLQSSNGYTAWIHWTPEDSMNLYHTLLFIELIIITPHVPHYEAQPHPPAAELLWSQATQ